MAGVAAEQVGSYAAGAPLAPLSEAVAAVASVRIEELGVAGVAAGLQLVKRLEGATAAVKAELVRAAQTTLADGRISAD